MEGRSRMINLERQIKVHMGPGCQDEVTVYQAYILEVLRVFKT